jgi:hypothetical protein
MSKRSRRRQDRREAQQRREKMAQRWSVLGAISRVVGTIVLIAEAVADHMA